MNKYKYKPEMCQQLIDHMKQGFSFWSFASKINVSFDTLWRYTKEFPEFAEAKQIGLSHLLDFDERLGLSGSTGQLKTVIKEEVIKDPLSGEDRIVKHYAHAPFSQSYHIFKMKNRYPKMYRDKIVVENHEDPKLTRKAEKIIEVMKDSRLSEALKELAEKLSEE